jgi:hypothetical protein
LAGILTNKGGKTNINKNTRLSANIFLSSFRLKETNKSIIREKLIPRATRDGPVDNGKSVK